MRARGSKTPLPTPAELASAPTRGRQAISHNANSAPAREAFRDLYLQGIRQYRAGKTVEAEASLTEALRIAPENAEAWSVLGVVHAMGSLDSSPEVLGGLIGAALVGTFAGIFLSYGVVQPISAKIHVVRTKQLRLYTLVKQSLLAFMNGAMPQVAVEFGRKTIPAKERPTIDTVENETSLGGSQVKEAA